ncbi:MAG: ABC transporter permease [Candidatus Nanopelagicales bacterium]
MSTPTSTSGAEALIESLDRRGPLHSFHHLLHKYPWISPLMVLVVAIAIFGIINPRFLAPSYLGTITQQVAVVATIAIAQTLVILTAGIDLSVGAVAALAAMVMAKTAAEQGVPGPLALLLGLILGAAAGALNGALVTRLKLPPFIVTLGTLSIFTAITLIYASARTINGDKLTESGADILLWTGTKIQLGSFTITYGVVLMVLLFFLFAWVLKNTAWGKHVYAVGDDPGAAALAGIRVNRVLFSVYVVGGIVLGIAGWMSIGRVGAASPSNIADANLDSITAVVIGGTSLFGGRGTMLGTLIGAILVGVVGSGLTLAGLDQAYKVLAIGVLIIIAVALDQWIRKVRG